MTDNKLFDYGGLQIHQDLSGISSTGSNGDLSWCWRLWEGAIAMSKHLEANPVEVRAAGTVLELGSGTGLVSLVVARLGANAIATDLASALPAFNQNATANLGDAVEDKSNETKEVGGAKCPIPWHSLTPDQADCEDYVCNVCFAEIEEKGLIYSCRECDFDICEDCDQKALLRDWRGMPDWFKAQCEAGSTMAGSLWNADEKHWVFGHALDWSDDSGVQQLMQAMEHRGLPSNVGLIVAADTTYNIDVVHLLVQQLDRLRQELPPTSDGVLKALVLHEPRSPELYATLVEGLGKCEMPFEVLDTSRLGLPRAADMVLLEITLR